VPTVPALALAAWEWTLLPLLVLAVVWALFVLALYVAGRGPAARALARLIPDLVVLFKRLLADDRVPRRSKAALAAVVGYLLLPIDVVPDFIPVVGQLDDAIVVGFVLRFALGSTGPDLITELWPGPPESLTVVLAFAGHRRRSSLNLVWAAVFGILLPAVAFVMLAEDVWEREAIDWDTPILRFFDRHQDATLTFVARGVTQSGGAALVATLLLAAAATVLVARLHRETVFLVVSVAGAGVLNVLLKDFFDRPRPDVFPHLVETATSSFPSGHTMSSAALALALIVVLRRSPYAWPVGALVVLYAVAVATSRVYLGVHFPSDVVAGWTVAVGWVTLSWLAVLDRPWRARGRRRAGAAGGDLPDPGVDAPLDADAESVR
jgi:membrane-associated phospholipid phosphatase/uncharacterized membrane protein YkvA (DUF1232 family)